MKSVPLHDKLLSHRLRGFDRNESTVAGLRHALRRKVAHLELDVRITADRKFLVTHDPFVRSQSGKRLWIARLPYAEIVAQAEQTDLASLEEMLSVVRDESENSITRIHIDIKDAGAEAELLQLVDSMGLFSRVTFISWIARTVFEIHRIRPDACLCFSHWTFFRWPALFRVGAAAAAIATGAARLFAAVARTELEAATLRLFPEPASSPGEMLARKYWLGWNHAHLLKGVVAGDMARILAESGGMVCVPICCANRRYAEQLHAKNIQIAVFAVNSARQTKAVEMRIGPDIIFCDDADQF